MSESTHNPADVELVADAVRSWRYIADAGDGSPASRTGSAEEMAAVALAALAAAGRLQPGRLVAVHTVDDRIYPAADVSLRYEGDA